MTQKSEEESSLGEADGRKEASLEPIELPQTLAGREMGEPFLSREGGHRKKRGSKLGGGKFNLRVLP